LKTGVHPATTTDQPVMTATRYDIRCPRASWYNETIHGSYSDAYNLASIISEQCMARVDIMREKGINLVIVETIDYLG